jgi:hypothetical protein
VSKVASHGPADVEADHHLPRRAGSGGQRGAPAGCGCELRNSGSLSAKAKRGETKYLKSAGLRVSGFSFSAISPKPSVCWQYPPETTSASWITAPFFCWRHAVSRCAPAGSVSGRTPGSSPCGCRASALAVRRDPERLNLLP